MKVVPVALLSCVLFAACAQVRELTGGEQDKAGPYLLGADPPNFTTGFTGDRIVLHFDERVQLDRVRERLLVSPPLDELPIVQVVRGTDVVIALRAALLTNTTYTFCMGEVVKDLTEGNHAAGMDYVIGTGATLDSLSVHGAVMNAFTGVGEEGALVMLYDAEDTINVTNGRPLYAARSDSLGAFHLSHLRNGVYKVAALRDQNANYRYDLPNEQIAFVDSGVVPATFDSASVPLIMRLFQERSASQSVREAGVMSDGAWRVILSRPAGSIEVKDIARIGGVLTWEPEWNPTRDTVLLWPSDTTSLGDGKYELSTDMGALDTLRYRTTKKMPFFTGLQTSVHEEGANAVVRITATRPIAAFDTSRFQLVQDSVRIPLVMERDSGSRRKLILRAGITPGTDAKLLVLPKAVRDIYGGQNDTLRAGVGRAAEQRTGTLRVTVSVKGSTLGPLILQLLDGQDRIVREVALGGDRRAIWEKLLPGNHKLRLIEDRDSNGHWDTGQWSSGLQPERVWHQGELLNIRAAWDLGITWDLVLP